MEKISEEKQKDMVWTVRTWDMTYTEKTLWMFHTVTQLRTAKVAICTDRRHFQLFVYWLQDSIVPKKVCKAFFLSTLEYHPKNNSLVMTMIGRSNATHQTPPKGMSTLTHSTHL